MSKDFQLNILEAEGELNREITSSLLAFRKKITDNMSEVEQSKKDNDYDINKAGPEKTFKFRESLLSLMFETRDFKTLYNMVVASFCILTFCLLYDNYITHGAIINVTAFLYFFRGAQIVFLSWWMLAFIQYTIIPITKFAMKSSIIIWGPIYIVHLGFLVYLPISIVTTMDMGLGSVFILMCEGVRMMMKSHAYFRTKLLYLKENDYKDFEVQGIRVNDDKKNSPKIKITMLDIPG